ncbi:hypothetical protein JY651_00940 [Pyxidicoccus parkwayensis]|uniref:Uncharacterized protein n=1 Tax=Pyxidicoccus parkwayensis TaxID=2813578 RepID=A0ABX7NXW0_9BACT|nr:hypothetical protein [Pyxidicoccus parkwaysis]QSQ23583.1 hypothetical protein JY651_00940 [Pyxidicoccus parkwaysis]
MLVTEDALRRFIVSLRKGSMAAAPSPAVRDFAERARTLDPRGLVREGTALLKAEEEAAVARVVLRTLRGLLGDIEEHGDYSEFADEAPFVRRAVSTWKKRVDDDEDDVLLADDLESSLVAVVPSADITQAEVKAWKVLSKSRRLATALTALVKKPVSPWFAELAVAYIGREVTRIAKSPRAESWQSKLDDVPVLLGLLPRLGTPPIFTPRVLRAANLVVLCHKHAPTREALAAMGALEASKADSERAARITRMAAVRAGVRAANARRATKTAQRTTKTARKTTKTARKTTKTARKPMKTAAHKTTKTARKATKTARKATKTARKKTTR